MKKVLLFLLCISVSIQVFANGGGNPLLGKWDLFPQFILSGGRSRIAEGDRQTWEFKDDTTLVVDGEITMHYQLSDKGDRFTLQIEDSTVTVYYYMVNDNVISLALYLEDADQYNVAVLTRAEE